MAMECKYKDIQEHLSNVCDFVSNSCDYSYINFYAIHYCAFDSYLWLTLPVLAVFGFFCFFLLSDTSNKYLSVSLTLLSDKLKISQNLAGLTFLALGNGAPDVISSIVASGDENDGIDFSLGALMGAGVFVTSFVFSSVIFFAKEVKVNKVMFIRDIFLFLLTIGILSIFSWDGRIKLWESIIFGSIYLLYVIVAIIQDVLDKNKKKLAQDEQEQVAKSIAEQVAVVHHFNNEEEKEDDIEKKSSLEEETENNINPKTKLSVTSLIKDDHFYDNSFDENSNHLLLHRKNSAFNQMLKYQYYTLQYRIKKHYFNHGETNFNQKNIFGKIFYILFDFPLTLVRDLTIPPCEQNKWNKWIFMFMPIFIFSFVVAATQFYQLFIDYWIVTICIGVAFAIWAVLIWVYTYRSKLPECESILCVFNFLMSMFWIWFVSQILVDILKVIGVIFDIPEFFLGMTLLAFGNSAPDLSVNVALAKAGYGEMGIAGSIAGPLFNVLIGLGVSLIKKNFEKGEIPFTLFDFNKRIILLISVLALSINLIALLIQGVILRFRFTKSMSYIGYIIYLLFFGSICYFVFAHFSD